MATIFNFDTGFQLTQYKVDRAYTLTASQLRIRSAKEVAAMQVKHDDELQVFQKALNRVSAGKFEVTDAVADIKNALNRIIDIRTALYEARAAAKSGDRAGFDNALLNINFKAGSARDDSSNLIGWGAADSRGTQFRSVSAGFGMGLTIHSRSLAATYSLKLDNGDSASIGFKQNTITLNGEVYSLGEINYESEADGKITFSVGEGEEKKTFTGVLNAGGLEIANSWAYGNLATQEGRDAAFDAVSAAIKSLEATERSLNMALGQAEYLLAKVTAETEQAQKALNDTIERHLTEEQALQRALEAREQIALMVLSLGAQQSLTQIDVIFRQDQPQTETVLDIFGLFD